VGLLPRPSVQTILPQAWAEAGCGFSSTVIDQTGVAPAVVDGTPRGIRGGEPDLGGCRAAELPDVLDPVVGCLACQFDWQVYDIEIEFAWIRRRPTAVLRVAKFTPEKQSFIRESAADDRQMRVLEPSQSVTAG